MTDYGCAGDRSERSVKKNAIRTLIAVSTASLALVAAGPATAVPPELTKQSYADVPTDNPIWVPDLTSSHDVQMDDHGIAWVSGSGGIRG